MAEKKSLPTTLQAKLERLFLLKDKIAGPVKEVYEEHNRLIIDIVEHLASKKGASNALIWKAPITLALKGDENVYTIKPTYMKDGQVVNTIWKPCGVQAFDVTRTPRPKKAE